MDFSDKRSRVPDPHEGLVGAVFQDSSVFVTSPNTNVVFPPLHGVRSIRLRQQLHFGEEDPLYFPQPFSPKLPHLPLIPLPTSSSDDRRRLAWYRPQAEDFEEVNPEDLSGTSSGLVILKEDLKLNLRRMIENGMSSTTLADAEDDLRGHIQSDDYITNYTSSLQWLSAQLDCASSVSRAGMTVALIQRIFLEKEARADWLANHTRPRGNENVEERETLAVIGALVDDLETAFKLKASGIPFWLVRPLSQKFVKLRVDKWLEGTSSVESMSSRCQTFSLSLLDAEPAHPVVWEGRLLADNFERYSAMSRYLRRFVVSRLYVDEQPGLNDTPSGDASGGSQKVLDSANRPHKRQRTDQTGPPPLPPPETRNKFDEVESEVMPSHLKPWGDAAKTVGLRFNPNMYSRPLGYFLPDPQMIARSGLESGSFATRNAYIDVWLRLRGALLFRLKTSAATPLQPGRWRTILGITKMGFKSARAAKQRKEVEVMLTAVLRDAGLKESVDVSKLSTLPSKWKGTVVDVGNESTNMIKEILWELFEISFRCELLLMDQSFYCGSLPREEREPEVLSSLMRHFEGSIVPRQTRTNGFDALTTMERRLALMGLVGVMDDWNRTGELTGQLKRGSDLRRRLDVQVTEWIPVHEVNEIEYAVAHHFISTFATTFGRAPTLPHRV